MANHNGLEKITLPIAIIIAAVILGGCYVFAAMHGGPRGGVITMQNAGVITPTTAQPAQPSTAKAADVKAVKSAGAMSVGVSSAPVVIAYWYDYQCPFCKQNEAQVIGTIMNDYVNTGKIRILFKDLQFLGADSTSLGLAERAVWEVAPSKFYAWHKTIYENQGRENSGWATKDMIRSLTAKVLTSAETDRVMSLMVSKATTYQAAMDADKAEGAAFGVRSTPSMIVGKTVITGARDYASVKAAIETALQNK